MKINTLNYHNNQRVLNKPLILKENVTLSKELQILSYKGAQAIKSQAIAKISFKGDMYNRYEPENFHKVDNQYYRGAEPSADQIEYLKNIIGIKTVINLKNENDELSLEEKEAAKKFNINYVEIPWDYKKIPTEKDISLFRKIIDDKDKSPVYVHCKYGQDRTGTMSGLYRVWKYGWDFDQVYNEMLKYGHDTSLVQLKKFLQDYCVNKDANKCRQSV